jgi:hypothetical protein
MSSSDKRMGRGGAQVWTPLAKRAHVARRLIAQGADPYEMLAAVVWPGAVFQRAEAEQERKAA